MRAVALTVGAHLSGCCDRRLGEAYPVPQTSRPKPPPALAAVDHLKKNLLERGSFILKHIRRWRSSWRTRRGWRRFSHEGARRLRVAVQVWPWFETLGQNPQHPDQLSPDFRLGVWLHAARTSERFRDIQRACRDEFLCSRPWHAWRHPRRKLDFGSFQPAPGFSSCDRGNGRIRGQPTFFCRVLGRSAGFAVATFLALPAIGSSTSVEISGVPSTRSRRSRINRSVFSLSRLPVR